MARPLLRLAATAAGIIGDRPSAGARVRPRGRSHTIRIWRRRQNRREHTSSAAGADGSELLGWRTRGDAVACEHGIYNEGRFSHLNVCLVFAARTMVF